MKSVINIYKAVFLVGFVYLFTSTTVYSQYLYEAKAKKGDGIYSMLRRYDLLKDQNSIKYFLADNNIEANTTLIVGKKYKMPVYIYDYDGKSIRSTIGDSDLQKALRIKAYNEYLRKNRLRSKNYIESKILWVPRYEIEKTSTEVAETKIVKKEDPVKVRKEESVEIQKEEPVKAKKEEKTTPKVANKKVKPIEIKKGMNRYYKLFGPKYSSVPIQDNSLRGRVFYIMSGHGGPDPGAMCKTCTPKLCEDEYAYDVSLRLARDFMQHGAIVHLIVKDKNDGIRDEKYLKCDSDEVSQRGNKIPLSQKKRLRQRAEEVNSLYHRYKKRKDIKSQTLIVTHVDSRHHDKRIDVYFSYAKGSKTGKKLAKSLHKTFKKKYSKYQKGRGYKGSTGVRNWYVLRNTLPSAVFIELANIKNPKDHERILRPSNRQALANWIFEGVRATFK